MDTSGEQPDHSEPPGDGGRRSADLLKPTDESEKQFEARFAVAIRAYLSSQRANGHFVLVSVLFAGALVSLVAWLEELLRAAPLAMKADYWPALISLVLELASVVMFFYVTVMLWTYFSRVLVYHRETPRGEVYTFALGVVLLLTIGVMSFRPEWWAFGMAASLYTISMKNRNLCIDLIGASEPESSEALPTRTRYNPIKWLLAWIGGVWPYMPLVYRLRVARTYRGGLAASASAAQGGISDPLIKYAYRWYAHLFLLATLFLAAGLCCCKFIPHGWLSAQLNDPLLLGKFGRVHKIQTGWPALFVVLAGVVSPVWFFGWLFSNAYTATVNKLMADAREYAKEFYRRQGFLPYDY